MSVSLITKNTKTVMAAGGNACAYMIITGLLTSCLLNVPAAQAADALRLKMSSGEVLRVGDVNDGTRITQGHIVTGENHAGFQVRSDARKSGSQPNIYILTGIQNSANTLRVRIEGTEWHPDNTGGQGIVLNTCDNIATFDVVTDGGQRLVADRYRLEVQGATIADDNSGQANASDIQSVNINVGEVSTVTHTLTAVTGLQAGRKRDGILLADGTVTTTDGTAQILALRFTDSIGAKSSATNKRIYYGKSDLSHQLRVRWEAENVSDTKADDWWITTPPKTRVTYNIRIDGTQDIAADTYTISMDAAIWSV